MDVPTTVLGGSPPSPPLGSLGKALADIHERPLMISMGAGFVVGLGGPIGVYLLVDAGLPSAETAIAWLWAAAAVCAVSMALGTATAAFLPGLLVGKRDRAASAVHAWVGAREVRRMFGSASAAVNIPTEPEAAAQWLATQPDTLRLLPLRFEMLLLIRDFEGARAVIDRFPRESAFDEYRRADALATVDEQQYGRSDVQQMRDALARVPRGIDRAEAAASLAVFEARQLVGRGDWREPLVRARPEIPGSDLEILTRDMGWPIFRYLFPRVVLPVVGFIAAIAVLVTLPTLF
jgi:hypothetical protein